MENQLYRELNDLIAILEQPLASVELANGWSPEAQIATLAFLRSIRKATSEGSKLPDVSGAARALDHWGVLGGPLLEKFCTFYNHLRLGGT